MTDQVMTKGMQLMLQKIKKLGWKPKVNFKTGIKETIDWYLENEKWWRYILKNRYNLLKE